jgi:hypothetical protein
MNIGISSTYPLRSGAYFALSGPISYAPCSTWNYNGLPGTTSAPCNTDATRTLSACSPFVLSFLRGAQPDFSREQRSVVDMMRTLRATCSFHVALLDDVNPPAIRIAQWPCEQLAVTMPGVFPDHPTPIVVELIGQKERISGANR